MERAQSSKSYDQVNSPRLAQKTKGIKISDLDDYEDEDNKQQPLPDFITQVAPSPSAEEDLPETMEQSSCFCSTSCFFGVGKSNKNRNSFYISKMPVQSPRVVSHKTMDNTEYYYVRPPDNSQRMTILTLANKRNLSPQSSTQPLPVITTSNYTRSMPLVIDDRRYPSSTNDTYFVVPTNSMPQDAYSDLPRQLYLPQKTQLRRHWSMPTGLQRSLREANPVSNYPTTTASFERVEVRTEKRASIIRSNTPERKALVQQTSVQLAAIPTSSNDGCDIPDLEGSCEEGDQKRTKDNQTETNVTKKSSEANPWNKEGEVVLVSEDETSSTEALSGLLGPKLKKHKGMKCLVLDLDETLVHSSFKPVRDADYIVPVDIDRIVYKVYVRKRPFVDEFLMQCAKDYEVVVFTASLSKYANPLLDMLDVNKVVTHRLFRESCVFHRQAYVKDLTKLGRKMQDIIIVDNSALSYAFQPKNAIPITSWFNDRKDIELRELLPVLQTTLKDIDDVRNVLDATKSFEWICAQAGKTHTTAI